MENASFRSLYLSRAEWEHAGSGSNGVLDLEAGGGLPTETFDADPRGALVKFVQDRLRQGLKVVIVGKGKGLEALCRRATKAAGMAPRSIDTWEAVLEAEPGALLKLACDLEQGFIDAAQNTAVVTPGQRSHEIGNPNVLLSEPELRIGDIAVHEDHGVATAFLRADRLIGASAMKPTTDRVTTGVPDFTRDGQDVFSQGISGRCSRMVYLGLVGA